mgnify:CR=1 FL=1
MQFLVGYQVIVHDQPTGTKQVRFPKTKGRRIRKKWAKRPQNFKHTYLEQPLIDESRRAIICTTHMLKQLKAQLNNPTPHRS